MWNLKSGKTYESCAVAKCFYVEFAVFKFNIKTEHYQKRIALFKTILTLNRRVLTVRITVIYLTRVTKNGFSWYSVILVQYFKRKLQIESSFSYEPLTAISHSIFLCEFIPWWVSIKMKYFSVTYFLKENVNEFFNIFQRSQNKYNYFISDL